MIPAISISAQATARPASILAAENLFLPENAFAVEDAPNGVLSASRAGCRVIMVPDLTEPDEELMKHIEFRADNILKAAEYILGINR